MRKLLGPRLLLDEHMSTNEDFEGCFGTRVMVLQRLVGVMSDMMHEDKRWTSSFPA